MFKLMLQKLWHKKWMNSCLLLGSLLLIATVVSFPLYETAAYDRMLQDEFNNYVATNGEWPAINSTMMVARKGSGGDTLNRVEDVMNTLCRDLEVTPRDNIVYFTLGETFIYSTMNRDEVDNLLLRLGMMSNLPDHVEMVSGEMYSESGITEDGCIEVVVSRAGLADMNLLVGETLVFRDMKDANKQEIRLYVKGVFEEDDNSDFYWQTKPNDLGNVCLMNEDLFRRMFTGENASGYSLTCYYYSLFEYADIKADQVEHIAEYTDYLTEKSSYKSLFSTPVYREILDSYSRKQDRIRATLVILQIPVLILLGAFLFMISGQMYEMERNEISVIKSRGSSGGQIFRIYLYQSLFLTLVGGAIGIPLGTLFSRVLGSASNFLEFDSTRTLELTFTVDTWIYAGIAMVVTLLIMTLPAIKHSRVTIVKLKQQKAVKRKSWWEKIFLDVILLALSLYGYYSFSKSADEVGQSVLSGQALDPLLYISSSLFILGMGLLFLRLQPYIVQLIYIAGKRFWKPASYASFMENAKNGRKQQFIMLFLILTISLGMYHATVARTILQNARDNVSYLDGADIVLREVWTEIKDNAGHPTGDYIEPDYSKYADMEFAKSYTRVVCDKEAHARINSNSYVDTTIMAIHTKDFGSLTWLGKDLTGKHYYEYLNELAVEPEGILVSRNFADKFGFEVGDELTFENSLNEGVKGKIVDFFDYWPGYGSTSMELNPDGTVTVLENCLVVGHFSTLQQKWGRVRPYEVWIDLKDGYSSRDVYEWLEANDVRVTKYVDRTGDMQDVMEDPLFQGTNGVLTMGFLVTILLCAVGYLIYWIMSIRSREMIFGVLRACGMHKGELFHMLMNEQIFSGVFTVVAGIGIGKLASNMFVPMLQRAYAAADQMLPLKLVTDASDMIQLYLVIAGVMVLCLVVLIILIFKLNVAKALKLGEE